jgi:2',3'-cyclic-nucleotide 2'-phosphodiesterase (5'-nucleotidase family)
MASGSLLPPMHRVRPFALASLLPIFTACGPSAGVAPAAVPAQSSAPAAAAAPRVCAILSVNDTYRIEPSQDGTGGMAALRALRARLEVDHPDLLVLHAGDFLFPSLLSRRYLGAQSVDALNRLDGSDAFDPRLLVTFGNHELDDDRAHVVTARLQQAAFRWLSSNIDFKKTADGVPLVATQKIAEDVILPCGGLDVGVFAVTTDVKSAPYVERYRDPIEVARDRTRSLRERGAKVVVGLTHQPIDIDQRTFGALGAEGPDVIVGGHEHLRQTRSEKGRSVFKADSDARTANLLKITIGASGVSVDHRWIDLGPGDPPPDPAMKAAVDGWLERHDREYCAEKLKAPPGCLAEKLTVAGADLLAEEILIRRFETNLGDFVADQMLPVFAKEGAQIAFINSGSLRLNYNIPKGSGITRRVTEELFAYPAPLRLIEITGDQLMKVLRRATTGWTGQGHWLQIAGFAYRFDPKSGEVSGLTLLGPTPRPIAPTDRLKVVVNSFLVDPSKGQDGFTMIGPGDIIDKLGPDLRQGPDLKQLVIDAFRRGGDAGIAPRIDGRICNPERPGPCLAK